MVEDWPYVRFMYYPVSRPVVEKKMKEETGSGCKMFALLEHGGTTNSEKEKKKADYSRSVTLRKD